MRFVFSILFIVFISAFSISAQETISADELEKIYKNDDIVLVFAGSEEDYIMHITGALSVPHQVLCNHEPVKNLVKSPEEMAEELSARGVSSDKTIVVYDEGSGKYSSRMYWILKYLGAQNVKVLAGNLEAWKAGRKPITRTPTQVKPAAFEAKPNAGKFATVDEVKKATSDKTYLLVDARTSEEFNGTNDTDLRKGHIPSAVNVNYEIVYNEEGMLKSDTELKSIFEEAGVTPDKTVIAYCASGVRASSIFLALKQIGYPNVKVFDGSFLLWENDPSNEVVK